MSASVSGANVTSLSARRTCSAPSTRRQRPEWTVCVRPASAPEERPRLGLVARLPEDAPVERDERVDAEHAIARDGRRLAAGVRLGELGGAEAGDVSLLVGRHDDGELDAEQLEDRSPPRRARCEDDGPELESPGDHTRSGSEK